MTSDFFNFDRVRLAQEVVTSIQANREPADRMKLGRQADAANWQNAKNRGKPFLSRVYQNTNNMTMDELTLNFHSLPPDLQATVRREIYRKLSEHERVNADRREVYRAAQRVGITL